MEQVRNFLPLSPQTPQQRTKSLSHLARLPSTDEALREVERLKAETPDPRRPDTSRLKWAEARLADCQERDAIAATRPDGCWCLGMGGRDERYTRSGIPVYKEICPCPEGAAQEIKQDTAIKQAQDEAERKRIDTLWANAQIPARFKDMRLSSSPLAKANPALMERLRPPQDIFSDNPDWEDLPDSITDPYFAAMDAWVSASWFVYGPSGVGKTCLAVGLARARVESDYEAVDKGPLSSLLFVTAPRLLSELRSTYNRSQEDTPTEQTVLDKYIQADLLILDDLGAEQIKNTGWVEDRLYQIVGERHDELRPTIFTSNLTMDALAKRIGERITWRIVEMVGKNIIHLTGPNLRE